MIDAADVDRRVIDSYGREGVLAAYDPSWENPADMPDGRPPAAMAFIRPDGGSREVMMPASEVWRLQHTQTPPAGWRRSGP